MAKITKNVRAKTLKNRLKSTPLSVYVKCIFLLEPKMFFQRITKQFIKMFLKSSVSVLDQCVINRCYRDKLMRWKKAREPEKSE